MRLLSHFEVYQELPIKIDDVASYIVECGYVEQIVFHRSNDHAEEISALLYMEQQAQPYGPEKTVGACCDK